MNVLLSLFNLIDMRMLQMLATDAEAGDIAKGAIGATGSLITLTTSLIFGIATGANVLIARNIGSRNQEGVKRSVGTSLAFAALGSVAMMLVGIFGAEQFLIWTNCDPELLSDATLYFQMYFAGAPLLVFCNFAGAILRAKGDSRGPMFYMVIGGIVKVAVNAVLLVLMERDILALSIATIVSWAVSSAFFAGAIWKKDSPVRVEKQYICFYKSELKSMLHIGIPAGMQTALYSVANVIIVTVVNDFGKEATTGLGIANIYDGIIYQVSVGAAAAVMPYMSQNIGAGNLTRAKKAVTKGVWITVLLGGILGSMFALLSRPLASIMSDNPEIIAFAQQKIIVVSTLYFICGINEVMCAALRALKKPIIPTIATLVYMCGIRFVWVYAVFPWLKELVPDYALSLLYTIWPIGWILSIATLLLWYIPAIKKLEKE